MEKSRGSRTKRQGAGKTNVNRSWGYSGVMSYCYCIERQCWYGCICGRRKNYTPHNWFFLTLFFPMALFAVVGLPVKEKQKQNEGKNDK